VEHRDKVTTAEMQQVMVHQAVAAVAEAMEAGQADLMVEEEALVQTHIVLGLLQHLLEQVDFLLAAAAVEVEALLLVEEVTEAVTEAGMKHLAAAVLPILVLAVVVVEYSADLAVVAVLELLLLDIQRFR
jgi:hypothetical protein